MPKKRKSQNKSLPSRQCKKPKTVLFLRKSQDDMDYNESKTEMDYLDESEIIEISSDDRSEVAIVECVKTYGFTDMARKGQDFLDESCNNLDTNAYIDNNRSDASVHMSTNNTISISESETRSSVRSHKRRSKSSKKKVVKPMIEEMYIVESILAMREVGGVRQFLLKWEGFPDSENSWEPEENIDSKDIIMEYLADLEKSENDKMKDGNDNSKHENDRSQSSSITECNFQQFGNNDEKCISTTEDGKHNSEKECLAEISTKNDTIECRKIEIDKEINDKHKDKKVSKKKKNKLSKNKKRKDEIIKESEIDLTLDDEEMNISENDLKEKDSDGTVEVKSTNEVNEFNEIRNDRGVFSTSDENNVDELAKATNEREMNMGRSIQSEELEEESGEESDEAKDEDGVAEVVSRNCDDVVLKTNSINDDNKSRLSNNSQPNTNVGQTCENTYFPSNLPLDMQEIFQVEKILRMRWSHGVRYFYLKWEGFPDSENSWEPESNLECPELIEDFLNDLKKPKACHKTPESYGTRSIVTEVLNQLTLERLPDETRIREPVPVIKSGKTFPKEREPEVILASGIVNDELSFLIKWKNVDMANLVSARRANVECPQVVIRFYEENLRWQNNDGSVTILPDDRITIDEEAQEEERLQRLKTKKVTKSSKSIFNRLLMSSSPMKLAKSNNNKNSGVWPMVGVKGCRGRGRPPISAIRPQKPSMSHHMSPGVLQVRKLSTGTSRILNMINNFQSRKNSLSTHVNSNGGGGSVRPALANHINRKTMHKLSGSGAVTNISDMVSHLYDSMDMDSSSSVHTTAQGTPIKQYHSRDIPVSSVDTATFTLPPPIAPTTQVGPQPPLLPQGHTHTPIIMSEDSNTSHTQQCYYQYQPTSSESPPTYLSPSTRLPSLSHTFKNLSATPIRNIATIRPKTKNNSSIMAGPRSYQQFIINNCNSPQKVTQQQQSSFVQHNSPVLSSKQRIQQSLMQSKNAIRTQLLSSSGGAIAPRQQYLCPIQKQNSIDQLLLRNNNNIDQLSGRSIHSSPNVTVPHYTSSNQSQPNQYQHLIMSPDSMINIPQQQQQQFTIQQNNNPMNAFSYSQQYQSTPIQYQYIVNNTYQPVTNASHNYILTNNQNDVYYSPQDLIQQQNPSPITIFQSKQVEFSSQPSHPPALFDSQSPLQLQQTEGQSIRNSYLNLGAYL